MSEFKPTDSGPVGLSPIAKSLHCKFIETNLVETAQDIKKLQSDGLKFEAIPDLLLFSVWNWAFFNNKCYYLERSLTENALRI